MNDPQPLEMMDWRRLLTPEERRTMLTDIARVTLAAGFKELPEQPWSSLSVSPTSSAAPKSPVEQLAHIEQLLPPLAQAVQQISQSPLTSTITSTRPARPEHARRVTAGAWMAYARQSGTCQSLAETVTLLSSDKPENQAVKSFVNALKRDCAAIKRLAEAEDEIEAAGRANACGCRLERIACGEWWTEIADNNSAWTLPPTQREMLRPDYASISRLRKLYRQAFCFDWDHPLLTLPPRETWRLYEVWCLLTVYDCLVNLGWQPVPPSEFFAIRAGRLTPALATGERSRVLFRSPPGQCLTLTYNQIFFEGQESLSHTMQPDITLSDGNRIWVLDAKFKPYAEPGEEGSDINQMHAYKDAIAGKNGEHVAAAWCLYAGLVEKPRGQITYGRESDTPIGALCLRPGDTVTVTRLREHLRQWLT